MNKENSATLAGAILAALVAIQPAINAWDGTFHTKDIVQLALAAGIAFLGYITKIK